MTTGTEDALRAALKPFAVRAGNYDSRYQDMDVAVHNSITVGDLRRADAALSLPSSGDQRDALPDDVRELVIAARVAFQEIAFIHPVPESAHALDVAADRFADRVPWDDEPDDSLSTNQPAGAE